MVICEIKAKLFGEGLFPISELALRVYVVMMPNPVSYLFQKGRVCDGSQATGVCGRLQDVAGTYSETRGTPLQQGGCGGSVVAVVWVFLLVKKINTLQEH